MSRITVKTNSKSSFDILIEQDFNCLSEELIMRELSDHKVMIITDSAVDSIYFESIKEIFEKQNCEVHKIEINNVKSINDVTTIYEQLTANSFTRTDSIVALGGKHVLSMASYVASSFNNGLNLIKIPTSLLAMAEASINCHSSLEFEGMSNKIGTFYAPSLVIVNISCIDTLDDINYFSGFAEIMKCAIIKSSSIYEWLIENLYEICDKDKAIILDMIEQTINSQKIYLEKDASKANTARILNLGYTICNAICKLKNDTMSYGDCLALGIIAAAHISHKRDMLSLDEYLEIRDMFVPFNLPITIENIEIDSILTIVKATALNANGHYDFILLKKIGKAVIDSNVTEEEIKEALREIIFTEEDMME